MNRKYLNKKINKSRFNQINIKITYINTCLLRKYYRNIDEYIDRQINKYDNIYIYIHKWVDSQIYIYMDSNSNYLNISF